MKIDTGDKPAYEGKPRLFGTNGVRGVFGKDLDLNKIIDVTMSIATFFKKGPIVVGYDGRMSSQIISRLVCSSVNSLDIDVGLAGLIPTPCLQFATKYLGYGGGIMITASHNPPDYNGLKPTAPDGIEISREDEIRVEDIYYSKSFSRKDGTGTTFLLDNIVEAYIQNVLSLVDAERIRSRHFKIAMDIGNGAQGVVAPVLAKKLGCKILPVNGCIDGRFPGRGSEPTTDNLGMLASAILGFSADLGIAFDGDGDRSIFCDERGCVHWGDRTGALLVRHLLRSKHRSEEIVCPINTTMMVSLVANAEGSRVIHTKVGSVEVSREMHKRGAIIGLEENGGFMYGRLNHVRDGAMTMVLVLDMLASEGKTFSQLLSELPSIFQFKTKFRCPSRRVADEIVHACIHHGSPKKIETLDGAKMWADEDTWVMVRPSGTEPLVRMYAESSDQSLLNSKVGEYRRLIEDIIHKEEQ